MDGMLAERAEVGEGWARGLVPARRTEPDPQCIASSATSPRSRWRRVFPGAECQVGVLRRWLCSLLPECPARDDVALVASELGANAVEHTASGRGDWFAVEVTRHPARILIAVADAGAATGPREVNDPDSESGRGMFLVRALSERYGTCGDEHGRLVWADIPWQDPASPAPAESPGGKRGARRESGGEGGNSGPMIYL